MTLERPMFPPRADEHCQIISLVDRQKAGRRISIRGGNPCLDSQAGNLVSIELEAPAPVHIEKGISETLKNRRLRDARKEQWGKAEATCEYWHASRKMISAVSRAQSHGIAEGTNHLPHDPDAEWAALANWRLSIAAQLMTPAPDTRAIAWKKTALAGGQWKWSDLTEERIKHAIAADEAFLNAHPTRTKLLKQRGRA